MMFGKHAFGVQQFELVSDSDGASWSVRWSNIEVSCTSSIPVLSTRVSYECFLPGSRREKTFTLESVDWDSGKSLWHKALGHSLAWNSQYAGTEIGTYDDVIMGTLTGILRVTTKDSLKNMAADGHLVSEVITDPHVESEDPRWVALQNIQEAVDDGSILVDLGYRAVIEILNI